MQTTIARTTTLERLIDWCEVRLKKGYRSCQDELWIALTGVFLRRQLDDFCSTQKIAQSGCPVFPQRVMSPVERGTPLPKANSFYQPIFRSFLEVEDSERFLANNWVREHTAHMRSGYGKIFFQKRDSVQVYPDIESLDWIPSEAWKTRLDEELAVEAYCIRNRIG